MTTIGSLFSGIGGLERGLESVGLGPVRWQAESDEACRRVLARHYPRAKRYEDVRHIDHEAPPVDIICGGSPCTDISNAGRRAGIMGEQSGLWSEFARIIAAIRPSVVFFENVAAITSSPGRAYCICSCQRRQPPFIFTTVCQFCGRPMGAGADQPPDETALGTVLGDLAALGYDACWTSLRASDVGAPHRRERLFILAYTDRERVRELHRRSSGARGTCSTELADDGEAVAHAHGEALPDPHRSGRGPSEWPICPGQPNADGRSPGTLAHSDGPGRELLGLGGLLDREREALRDDAHRCDCPRCYVHRFPPGPDRIADWDGPQPAIRRGDDGSAGRIRRRDSLRALGNAVVWQQAAEAWDTLVRMVLA